MYVAAWRRAEVEGAVVHYTGMSKDPAGYFHPHEPPRQAARQVQVSGNLGHALPFVDDEAHRTCLELVAVLAPIRCGGDKPSTRAESRAALSAERLFADRRVLNALKGLARLRRGEAARLRSPRLCEAVLRIKRVFDLDRSLALAIALTACGAARGRSPRRFDDTEAARGERRGAIRETRAVALAAARVEDTAMNFQRGPNGDGRNRRAQMAAGESIERARVRIDCAAPRRRNSSLWTA